MQSQRVAFTPSVGPRASETSILSTESLRFSTVFRKDAFTPVEEGLDQAPFQPVNQNAEVKLDAVNQMFGQENETLISYAEPYINDAFGSDNKGCVFAEIGIPKACEPAGIDFKRVGDRAMGFGTPDMNFAGLSAL